MSGHLVAVVVLFVVSAISFSLARHAARLTAGRGTRLFSALMIQIGWWASSYALELISPSLEAKVAWAKVQYMAIVLVPVTWFFFTLTYTDRWPWLRTPHAAGLSVGVAFLVLAAVWTNEYHRLFWTTVGAAEGNMPAPLVVTYGPLFFLFVAYANVLLAVGSAVLFRNLWRPFRLYRRQAAAVALGIFIPWTANLLYLMGLRLPLQMDPTPFAFGVTGLMLFWGLGRFQLLDIAPLARDRVMEHMQDGVLILDARGRVVDANAQAAVVLQTHGDALVGHTLDRVCPALAHSLMSAHEQHGGHAEVQIGQMTLEITTTPLAGQGDESVPVGYLVVLRDITARKRVEQMLEGQTQILSRLVTGASLNSILDHIVLTIEELIPGAIGSILLIDKEQGQLYHVAAPSLPERYVQAIDGVPVGPNAGSFGSAAYYRKPVVVADIARDPMWREWRDVALSYGLRSCWTVPIVTPDKELVGALTIYHTRRYTPSGAELEIVERAGHLVTLAVEREQNRSAMHRRETVLKAVAFAAETLLRAGNWEPYIHHTLAYLASALGADRAFLFSVSSGPHGSTLARRHYLWTSFQAGDEERVWANFAFEEEGLERWVRVLQRGMPVYGLADVMSAAERNFLARQGARAVALLPVFAGNTWWGFVGFDRHTHSHIWSNAELDALKSVAALFGAAVQRWQLDQERQRQMEEVHFLNQITGVCLRADRLDDMLQTVAAHLAEFFEAHTCTIALWDRLNHTFVPAATSGQTIIPPATLFPESVRVLIETALRTGRPQTMNRVPMPPHSSAASRVQEQRLLAVPVASGQHWLGAILVEFRRQEQLTSQRIDVAERVAAQVALAIARLHAVETAHRRAEEAETLRQAGTIVASTLDLDEAIDRILAQLACVIPHDSASVQLLHHDEKEGMFLEIVGGWGWQDMSQVRGLRFPIPGGNPNTTVVLERRPVVLGDAPAVYPSFRHPPHNHIRSWMGVPLIVRNKVIGMLSIDSTTPHHFTAQHVRLVTAFADQVAIAIENARLHRAVEHKARENARLYEAERQARRVAETLRLVNIAISQELDPDAVLETLLNHAQRLIPCDTANVLLCEGGDRVRLHTLRGYERWTDAGRLKNHVLHLDNHPHLRHILEHESSLIIADTSSFRGWIPDEPPGTTFVRSWLGVPLIAMHEVVGILSLDKAEPNFFTEEHRQIAEALAAQAAVAIQNARLFARVQRHAGQLRALYRATQTLLSTLDLDTLLQRVLEAAIDAIPAAEKGALLLADETGRVTIRALHGYTDPRVRAMEFACTGGYSAKAIREGRPLLVPDADQPDIRYTGDIEEVRSIRSAIVVPLVLHGQVLGAISLDATRPNAFTVDDLNLLETFAATATAAIRNAQLHQEVRWQAIIDSLTGAYNRRGLFELGRREVARAVRFRRPLSLIMFDLDHFKRVNDSFGHATGDQVLVKLIQRIRSNLRNLDLLGRYGGEEFVVLLPETSVREAYHVAERIRQAVMEAPLETNVGPLEISISLGVAELDEQCADLDDLIERADQALYRAKEAGRNRTFVWGSELRVPKHSSC